MSTRLFNAEMVRTLFAISIVAATAPLEAQGTDTGVFAPPGMPVLKQPGTIQVVPGAEMGATAGSPFTQEKRLEMVAAREASKRRGWTEVTEARARHVDSYFDRPELQSRFLELHDIGNTLTIVPTVLQGTLLERAVPLGALPSGAFANGGWTGLTRVFTVPELGRVVLEEFDYVAAGTQITIPAESIDGDLNGMPVITDAYRAPSGNGYTEFVWFTERKQFTLLVGKYLPNSDRSRAQVRNLMMQLY